MRLPAEHACGGRTEVPDRSTFVDDDPRVGYGFEDREQMRLTTGEARGTGLRLHPCTLIPFSADGNCTGDHKTGRYRAPAADLAQAYEADTPQPRDGPRERDPESV